MATKMKNNQVNGMEMLVDLSETEAKHAAALNLSNAVLDAGANAFAQGRYGNFTVDMRHGDVRVAAENLTMHYTTTPVVQAWLKSIDPRLAVVNAAQPDDMRRRSTAILLAVNWLFVREHTAG